ncbi:HPP family protein [Acinetobacter courvalinii]|uniref:HPP family protein n=1 Tax=Acinetobacter courvalinii TaxID=280147 RepID=A0AA42I7Y4_9GAMM|nr:MULTISPECIES: HPP family protein [Acinetobacter]MBJ8418001.1 HPP family protein [Acinetobacter courvalinii]MBJ9956463.1 HPP family protein [Acinetobacter courvalinii]MCU4368457.1 HPP family protein [Acinetobacter courvalinii]MCU4391517.1 HPP family protein [Acinetobacter courvalinii]MCU4446827.1 HPP family protein [Acinetobacter courvalinii]
MSSTQSDWLNLLKPNYKVLPLRERMLSGVGALCGLAISSLISWYVLGGMNAWYIAPMGASSVLLFAVPNSPLAQPWNVVVGNTLAGLIGVACTQLMPDLTTAFSVAVGLAIFMMMTTDSLHPPSGAVAITAVLGGEAVHRLGFHFILYPVLLNSILLLVFAVVFNRLIGRHYPLTAHVNERSKDPTPTQKVSIQPKDIEYALEHHTELLDISQYDLEKIILEAQEHANERLVNSFVCQDIMSRDVIKLHENDDIHQAVDKFKAVNLMSLPVVNAEEKLVGTLALYEVVEWFKGATDPRNSWQHFVRQIMSRRVVTVDPLQPIQDLVPYFVEKSFNYIPVVENQRLVGIISRADMIAALQQQLNQKLS